MDLESIIEEYGNEAAEEIQSMYEYYLDEGYHADQAWTFAVLDLLIKIKGEKV